MNPTLTPTPLAVQAPSEPGTTLIMVGALLLILIILIGVHWVSKYKYP